MRYTEQQFGAAKYLAQASQPTPVAKGSLTIDQKLDLSLNIDLIPSPLEPHSSKYHLMQTRTHIFYVYPFHTLNEVEVYYKGSKLGKNQLTQHVNGRIQFINAGYYSGFSEVRLMLEKKSSNPLRSNLSKVYSNHLHSMIKCDPPKDRDQHSATNRSIKMKVVNSGFSYKIDVIFGLNPWNKKAPEPPKSSDKPLPPPTTSTNITPPPSTSSNKSSGSSHNTTPTEQPSVLPRYLLVFSIAALVFLLIFLYCYRRQKLYDMNDVADLASLDASS